MTHRWRRISIRTMVAAGTLAIMPAMAQAQSAPVIKVALSNSDFRAGGYVAFYADVTVSGDALGQPVTAASDAKDVGLNKFVELMLATSFNADITPCAADHYCFLHIVQTDVYTPPGPHAIQITATDGRGRASTFSLPVTITAPEDRDGDGLPDVWASNYGVSGADGDPDGDGVSNLEEFRHHTNPIAKFQRIFTEGSAGEQQSLVQCFVMSGLDDVPFGTQFRVRVLAVGDNGRTKEEFLGTAYGDTISCPLGYQAPFVADRVVAVYVESSTQIAVERMSLEAPATAPRSLVNSSFGVQNSSREWLFARGTARADLDFFFLAYNPNPDPVEATFTFVGGAGDAPQQFTASLAPGARSTIWVNQDVPGAAAYDAATRVNASAGIFVERAWRYKAPGRTVAQDSVSRGAAVRSTWWYFAAGNLSDPFETSFAVYNPSTERTTVEARFLFTDREPIVRNIDLLPQSRQLLLPRDLGIGAASAGLVLHTANGVGIVAERTTDSRPLSGIVRQSALGVTAAGTTWVFAEGGAGLPDGEIVIANPSDVNGRAHLHWHHDYDYSDDLEKSVDVPARRVVHVSIDGASGGWLVVTSEATGEAGAAPIVVERASYPTVDGLPHARQVSVAGNLKP